MFRKLLFFILLLIIVAGTTGWYFFVKGSTSFTSGSKVIYIHTAEATPDAVLKALEKDSVITQTRSFNWLAGRMGYWKAIKPGRYRIAQGQSMYGILKQLRQGVQTPLDFTISRKIRQKEDFARLVARNFECDSATMMAYLSNPDTLRALGLDSASWMTAILNDTYNMTWTWPASRIFRKLQAHSNSFWEKNDRMERAQQLGYQPIQIYTLASIVAEETNKDKDKPLIASTYLNRLKIGMKLQADPTVKFAMKQFALNRILQKHLSYPSPYNTYQQQGLPPGPICVVGSSAIDAVLDAPQTDYLYFVADADLRGGSSFSSNYTDHLKLAHEYQDSLTAFYQRRADQKAREAAAKARQELE